MTLGDLIRSYRETNRLSLEEFAQRASLTRPYIWMLEKNKNTKNNKPIIPSVTTLKKVALAMNMPLNNLLEALDKDYPVRLETRINVSDAELAHLKKYRELTEAHRKAVDDLTETLYTADRADRVRKESQNYGAGESDAG